jgi:hypothetical protein
MLRADNLYAKAFNEWASRKQPVDTEQPRKKTVKMNVGGLMANKKGAEMSEQRKKAVPIEVSVFKTFADLTEKLVTEKRGRNTS